MKWSIFVCLVVCLARFCDGLALKCPPGVTDPSCREDRKDVDTHEAIKSGTTEVQCLVGSEWESNCHYCRCSDEGVAECLKQDTCDKGLFAEPVQCKPNTTFQRDCNTCICLDNGLGLCTLEYCRRSDSLGGAPEFVLATDSGSEVIVSKDESNQKSDSTDVVVPKVTLSRKVRAFTTEPPKTCQPGQEFRMDCNKCLCDNKGQDFSCTRIDCNALNNNHHASAFTGTRSKRDTSEQVSMQCVPGSVFDRDCNVCRCTEDGHFAACTLKVCKDKKPETEHAPESDLGFRCNPGEQFKRDCNDCTCSADGRSVFCTLRLCDI